MIIQELANDFRNFVFAVHPHVGLPEPTKLQYDICNDLQGDTERLVLMAFRGCSKSHLSALYAVWRLYKNREEKILVISATGPKARKFVAFAKKVIEKCPFLEHMRVPGKGLTFEFDVAGIEPSQNPSLMAKGLTSQITGERATIIIADDVEISTTTTTEGRDKIELLSAEFEDVLLPDRPDTRIYYLGTPHDAASFYNRLGPKGYTTKKYPIFDEEGNNVEPGRFSNELLEKRRISKGNSLFNLQYMLDTSMADVSKFPLHLSDLVVTQDYTKVMCKEEYKRLNSHYDFPVKEAKGSDRLFESESKGFEVPFTKIILSLDPAGGGDDDFAWHVLATRNSYIFSLAHGAWDTGLNRGVLQDIQGLVREYNVNEIVVETNFGDDLILNMMKPNINIPIIPIKNTIQKERRLISTLEPLMNQRKLIVNNSFIEDAVLMGQLCNLTKVRGCLKHDDAIDCLGIGVKHLQENLNVNVQAMKEIEYQNRLDAELASILGGNTGHNWMDN